MNDEISNPSNPAGQCSGVCLFTVSATTCSPYIIDPECPKHGAR